MQVSKITAMLMLGVVFFSSKANATDLPSTIELKPESKFQLAQANLQKVQLQIFKKLLNCIKNKVNKPKRKNYLI